MAGATARRGAAHRRRQRHRAARRIPNAPKQPQLGTEASGRHDIGVHFAGAANIASEVSRRNSSPTTSGRGSSDGVAAARCQICPEGIGEQTSADVRTARRPSSAHLPLTTRTVLSETHL